MAYSETLAERTRPGLAPVPDVEEKKIFGSLAFMVAAKMCLTASGDRMMCRINQGIHESAINKEGCQAVIMRGREYQGWVYVNEESLQAEAEFNCWVDLALDFNQEMRSSD